MWRVYIRKHRTVGPWVQRIESKPGWVWKAALIVAVLVVVVPVVLLTMTALMVGLAMLIVFGAVAWLVSVLTRPFRGGGPVARPPDPEDDGRVNVRVIERD